MPNIVGGAFNARIGKNDAEPAKLGAFYRAAEYYTAQFSGGNYASIEGVFTAARGECGTYTPTVNETTWIGDRPDYTKCTPGKTYGKSDTVQPKSYTVIMWERTS